MYEVTPDVSASDEEHENRGYKVFDPMNNRKGTMVCCCGFALIKADDDSYKCKGGGHTYRISEGQVELDKFGNALFRMPKNI